jgi:hypothetical protein
MIENIIVGTTKRNKCDINLTFYTWNIKNTGIVYFDFAARKFLIMKQNTFHSQSNFKLELVFGISASLFTQSILSRAKCSKVQNF